LRLYNNAQGDLFDDVQNRISHTLSNRLRNLSVKTFPSFCIGSTKCGVIVIWRLNAVSKYVTRE